MSLNISQEIAVSKIGSKGYTVESRYLELSSDQVRDSSGYSRKRDFEIARFNKFYK